MMVKVRTQPIEVFYLTGDHAREARESAGDEGDGPVFATSMLGEDGLTWETPEQFERDYAQTFGACECNHTDSFCPVHNGVGCEADAKSYVAAPSEIYG